MGHSILEKMGCFNSKTVKNEALNLCKERKRFVKQAIDSRCALAAAHVSYIQSLRNIGTCLRRYAEVMAQAESSLSTTSATTELEKSLSHSSPSSPSRLADLVDSPTYSGNGSLSPRPVSPPARNLNYMKIGTTSSVTFTVNPLSDGLAVSEVNLNEIAVESPAPPSPPLQRRPRSSSWDYFDTCDNFERFRFNGHEQLEKGSEAMVGWERFREGNVASDTSKSGRTGAKACPDATMVLQEGDLSSKTEQKKQTSEDDARKDSCGEREDPSEFITHKAKDFVSSVKDIEHKFFRASESGREVSRMLESNKIRVGFAETTGRPGSLAFLAAFKNVCCRGKTSPAFQEPLNHANKVIVWKRTSSSRSSSSRHPLIQTSKEDVDESGSEFMEEFCMISGSHSSTLDRLFAWERKLYDEVKGSETIRKEYDRKCEMLRNQFAKDQAMDKTRAAVKDLHSRIRVAIQSVDSISKRIERIRDEELQPQLMELIHGMVRMWKAMLECHHTQYITISLAYHSRNSSTASPADDDTRKRQLLSELVDETECFGLSFADLVNSVTSYVEGLSGWLHNCILVPEERSRNRRPWSPRRVLAPPMFVLCRDWSSAIKSLPSDELNESIKGLSSDLRLLMEEHSETDDGCEEREGEKKVSNLSNIHGCLTKLLERLKKFSEASLKMYEDVKQKTEAANAAYNDSNSGRGARPVRL